MIRSAGIRWTVRPGDGLTVRDVLARAGADANAVADGRVFVGRTRIARPDQPVHAGDVLTVAGARPALAGVPVLARACDLLAVDKPAGIPTIADHGGSAHALVAVVASMLGVSVSRVHATSRLDREVSGVVVFALTPEAVARARDARARGDYDRRYVALAARAPEPARGTWRASIGRDDDPRRRRPEGRDATHAESDYAVWARAPDGTALLALSPVTGRTHQLRVHAAHARAPLLGDRSYGGPVRIVLPTGRVLAPARIALHAVRVQLRLGQGEVLKGISPIPAELRALWSELGGDEDAWKGAAGCGVGAA